MEVCMDSKDAVAIDSPEEMWGRFDAEVMTLLPDWKRRLEDEPAELERIEGDVQRTCQRGGAMLVAGLLAEVSGQPAVQQTADRLRRQAARPLRPPEKRTVQIQLLGGLLLWITTLYCGPRARTGNGRGKQGGGLYNELAVFGFGKGCSPALQSLVARQAALCPSMQMAQQELLRSGLKLDIKAVRRIAEQTGLQMLTHRKRELLAWRAGRLPAGKQLAGKRVAVQLDGGRTRLRENGPPPPKNRKKGERRKFDTPWREPKLLIIFTLDEQGRMQRKESVLIDGTFAGPDHLAELVAYHLHRLGAAQAESLTFSADGAPWIWDRLGWIVEQVGIDATRVSEVLDFCHAAHHISLALAALSLSEQERRPLYREMRKRLRQGRWRGVVDDLSELAQSAAEDPDVHREIAYLRRHGETGRMSYPTFRSRGLPLGSGAIESSIRRVINLRLKGNGIFWVKMNAEAMLVLRATLLADNWDAMLSRTRASLARDRRLDWEWDAPDLSKARPEATQSESTPNRATACEASD